MSINSALSVEQILRTVTDVAREVVACHQAITLFLGDYGSGLRPVGPTPICSFSDKYADWRGRTLEMAPIADSVVARSPTATRLTEEELRDHPDWTIVAKLDIPPVRGGMLAAPLTGRDANRLGVIYVADPIDGVLTDDDEAVIVQLAQMASIAIENTIYSQEREANRLKDEFLATLSHELRTPLNAILGWTQLLRMEKLDGEVSHGLEVIERNVRSQAKLVEDLLDVSRIASGKMRLNTRPTPFVQVVQTAIDAVRPAIVAKHIDFVFDRGTDEDGDDNGKPIAAGDVPPTLVNGDPDRLQQVVWNLLSNAAKFTPAGGQIIARLRHDDATVRLEVSDTGQGIDPKFLPYVFDRFRQADSTSTRAHSGLGVGLAIVRHIVELHGGTVFAASAGPERGATFTVELPRCGGTDHQPAVMELSTAESQALSPPADVPSSTHVSDQPIVSLDVRLLLVDDDTDARDLQAELLRRHGAEVTIAASAEEAMEVLRRSGPLPDLIISDIAMPQRDGCDLIREVRQLPADEGGQIPAIALTAFARDDDRQRILGCGFNAHLSKPVDPSTLLLEVARLTTADRATDESTTIDYTISSSTKSPSATARVRIS